MPSGFIEASGYSKDDVDNAYDQGYIDGGGAALQGTATQAQVLEGYTFTSAAAGVNRQGTMTNVSTPISTTVTPGQSVGASNAYFSSWQVTGALNTDTANPTAVKTDLSELNLVRYINGEGILNTFASGLNDDNIIATYAGNIGSNTSKYVNLLSVPLAEDCLLVAVLSARDYNSAHFTSFRLGAGEIVKSAGSAVTLIVDSLHFTDVVTSDTEYAYLETFVVFWKALKNTTLTQWKISNISNRALDRVSAKLYQFGLGNSYEPY